MTENEDYELTPGSGEYWNIRVLTGKYVETVFFFGAITVNDDEESLSYNATVVENPFDEDHNFEDDLDWHKVTGNILYNIIETAVKNADTSDGPTG